VKRAIVAMLTMLASLAPPASSQAPLQVFGPVDLTLDTRGEGALRPGPWLFPERRADAIGLSVPIGTGGFSARYEVDPERGQDEARAIRLALGYYHLLDKDTTFYLVGARLRSGVTVRYQSGLPGRPRQLISIGIRRQF
jgi:hypothetical protein